MYDSVLLVHAVINLTWAAAWVSSVCIAFDQWLSVDIRLCLHSAPTTLHVFQQLVKPYNITTIVLTH